MRELKSLRRRGRKVVFTNGVFDLLHAGHVRYLNAARRMGDALVIGLNSDSSTRRIKGPSRPVQPARDRAVILAALECVNYVVVFNELDPLRLISALKPDILVKGADWPRRGIVGRDLVEAAGGAVRRVTITRGQSTTRIIRRIVARERARRG